MNEAHTQVEDEIQADDRIDRAKVHPEGRVAFLKVTDQRTRMEVMTYYRTNYNVDVDLKGFVIEVTW